MHSNRFGIQSFAGFLPAAFYALAIGLVFALGRAEAADVAAPAAHPNVLIQTSSGNITVALDPGRAPITVRNFLRYVAEHHFDGTAIYRVVPGFVIQAGS